MIEADKGFVRRVIIPSYALSALILLLWASSLLLSFGTAPAYAHVRYVLNQTEVEQALSISARAPSVESLGLTMLGVLLIIVAIQFIGLRLAGSNFARRIEAGLSSFDEQVPLIIRVLVGVFLLLSGLSGRFLAPQPGFELGAFTPLSAIQVVVGIFLILGLFTKIGALLLAALVVVAFWVLGVHGLDQFVLLGVSVMLFFEGGLHASVDSFTIARVERFRGIGEALMRLKVYSMPALRLSLGVNLIWLALTEKLLVPELTEAAVVKYNVPVFPELRAFVLFFGFFEVLLGAHFLLGIFNRLISLLYLLLLVLAIFLFGETLNHLHLFAVSIAFLIRGAGPYRMDIVLRS